MQLEAGSKLGQYEIPVSLTRDDVVNLKLWVVQDAREAAAAAAEAAERAALEGEEGAEGQPVESEEPPVEA